ncbi:MAG: hypothetical protein ACW99A_14565, partial [Candidatus Kariarchaeaceae archaeon]
ILSYNYEVIKALVLNYSSYRGFVDSNITIFHKPCLLTVDKPIMRVFVKTSTPTILSIVKYFEKIQNIATKNLQSGIVVQDTPHTNLEISIDEDINETQSMIDEINSDVVETETTKNEQKAFETVEVQAKSKPIGKDGLSYTDETKLITKVIEEHKVISSTNQLIEDSDNTNSQIEKSDHEISKVTKQTTENIVIYTIDEALQNYNSIFDVETLYQRLIGNNTEITPEIIFSQVEKFANNLENLNQIYLVNELRLDKEEMKIRSIDQLLESQMIDVYPTANEYIVKLANLGKEIVEKALKDLNRQCVMIKTDGIKLQSIMMNSSSIIEQFRQQGKVRYEVALIIWGKLLSLAYYDKFRRLTPFAFSLYTKIISIIDNNQWVANHDELVKLFIEKYQTKLYEIEQEILLDKPYTSKTVDINKLPSIEVLRPPTDIHAVKTNTNLKSNETVPSIAIPKIVTNLAKYNEYGEKKQNEPQIGDKEIIKITSYQDEDVTGKIEKTRKSKGVKKKEAKRKLQQQKQVFEELRKVPNTIDPEFDDLDGQEINDLISKRIDKRLKQLGEDNSRTLYFYQPSWDFTIADNKDQLKINELHISLFNLNSKTKRMLINVLPQPTIGELRKVRIDWTKIPGVGKITSREIQDFQWIFDKWHDLEETQIFKLMSRDGLNHLLEQKIYFNPASLPEHILLPLHEDLLRIYKQDIETIISSNKEEVTENIITPDDITRKIINRIYVELCEVLQVEYDDNHTEVLLHNLNRFQKSNYTINHDTSDPVFDLTWVLKFDNFTDTEESKISLSFFTDRLYEELACMRLPLVVQLKLLEKSQSIADTTKLKTTSKSNNKTTNRRVMS